MCHDACSSKCIVDTDTEFCDDSYVCHFTCIFYLLSKDSGKKEVRKDWAYDIYAFCDPFFALWKLLQSLLEQYQL